LLAIARCGIFPIATDVIARRHPAAGSGLVSAQSVRLASLKATSGVEIAAHQCVLDGRSLCG